MKKAYFKVRSICIGWWRFLFKKRSPLAKDRIAICRNCDLRKWYFCSVCWCELDALAELSEEDGGVCKYPTGSRWRWLDKYHKAFKIKGPNS